MDSCGILLNRIVGQREASIHIDVLTDPATGKWTGESADTKDFIKKKLAHPRTKNDETYASQKIPVCMCACVNPFLQYTPEGAVRVPLPHGIKRPQALPTSTKSHTGSELLSRRRQYLILYVLGKSYVFSCSAVGCSVLESFSPETVECASSSAVATAARCLRFVMATHCHAKCQTTTPKQFTQHKKKRNAILYICYHSKRLV